MGEVRGLNTCFPTLGCYLPAWTWLTAATHTHTHKRAQRVSIATLLPSCQSPLDLDCEDGSLGETHTYSPLSPVTWGDGQSLTLYSPRRSLLLLPNTDNATVWFQILQHWHLWHLQGKFYSNKKACLILKGITHNSNSLLEYFLQPCGKTWMSCKIEEEKRITLRGTQALIIYKCNKQETAWSI